MSSLASFYILAEVSQGRKARGALKLLPVLIAVGAGLAPHLASAVAEGLHRKAGEFVRTPKRGDNRWRYAAQIDLPFTELLLGAVSATAVVVSLQTGHWFATPFALLFALGYGYIATLLVGEQRGRRRLVTTAAEPQRAPQPAASNPGMAA